MNQILDFEGKGKKRKEVLDENQYKNTENISNSNYYNEYSYNENREYNQKGINSYNETYFDGLNMDFNRPNKKVIFLKYLTIFLIILTVLAFGFIVYTINKNDAETKKQNAIADRLRAGRFIATQDSVIILPDYDTTNKTAEELLEETWI